MGSCTSVGPGATPWLSTPHNPGTRRCVSGVRQLLGGFIRAVHPDLTPGFPPQARRINEGSLAQLNAFVDRLEVTTGPAALSDGPEVARELPFFRGHRTRTGRLLNGRVLPLHLPLPAMPPLADEPEREYLAARLIRDAELVLERTAGGFSDQPEVPPLFMQKGTGRKDFDRLWWQQTREEMFREALYGPDDDVVRLQAAKRVFACKYEHRLLRRYTRIRNSRRRRQKLASVEAKVEARVEARFSKNLPVGPHAFVSTASQEAAEEHDTQMAARVLQNGYHPDLVFVMPGLSDERRREAVRRVCGMNLTRDADFWLLENLWKAMRGTNPPVPLVVAEADAGFAAYQEAGFVQVPWNFCVSDLCDLLEEHLEDVRAGLLRRRNRAGMGAETCLLQLATAAREGAKDGSNTDEEDMCWSDSAASESESESEREQTESGMGNYRHPKLTAGEGQQ